MKIIIVIKINWYLCQFDYVISSHLKGTNLEVFWLQKTTLLRRNHTQFKYESLKSKITRPNAW